MYSDAVRYSFWKNAITGDDQLRQRVAFGALADPGRRVERRPPYPYELSAYVDMLNDNAFGNYRDLLRGVAYSSAMGRYLDHLRNDGNRTANENFAREMLELFSVGLTMLNIDGTAATPLQSTYTEGTVKGFSKVFTGLSYDDQRNPLTGPRCISYPNEVIPSWTWSPDSYCPDSAVISDVSGWTRPMVPYDGRHSNESKELLQYDVVSASSADPRCTSSSIVANQNLPAIAPEAGLVFLTRVSATTARSMIERALDNIFCHPNVGPFIAKQLIQRLVTSTPTPGYVGRVAATFNNDGRGVRGDMKAVVRAILLDDEALDSANRLSAADRRKFGKLREPVLRLSALLRAFPRPIAPSNSGHFFIGGLNLVENGINQNPFQAPSVFNFYRPDFAPPGAVSQAAAFGPEFEITTTTSIAATQNYFGSIVTQGNFSLPEVADYGRMGVFSTKCNTGVVPPVFTDCIFMSYDDLYPIVSSSSAMFDYLNLVLLGGKLPASAKDAYVAALDAGFPPNFAGLSGSALDTRRRDRVKAAVWLAVGSPEFQVEY